MLQEALSSIKRIFFKPKDTMVVDAKDVSDECFLLIFHRLDNKSLINCMLTCHRLKNLISTDSFWVEHARHTGIQNVLPSLAWRRAAAQKKFILYQAEKDEDNEYEEGWEEPVDMSNFNFNLQRIVLSGIGYSPIHPKFISMFENSPNHTVRGTLRSDDFNLRAHGDGIVMELDGENGCNPHPDVSKCFAFSFSTSSIFIFVDLVASGIDPWVLDHVRPKIRITQKVNHRHDCSAQLIFAAQLNYFETQWIAENWDEQLRQAVDKPRYKSVHKQWDQWTKADWEDVSIEFADYPSGLRHLTVLNEGRDGQFWRGFYGPKVANIKVEVILPDEPIVKSSEEDTERRQEDEDPEDMDEGINRRVPLFRRHRGMWGVPPAVLHEADDE